MSCNCPPGASPENSVYHLVPGPAGPIGSPGIRGVKGDKGDKGNSFFSQFQSLRSIATIPPGITVVDFLWATPFPDNNYFVLFPNPPFAPGAVLPPPPVFSVTDDFTNPVINPLWTPMYGVLSPSVGNQLRIATNGPFDNRAVMGFSDPNWQANQYSQVRVTAVDTTGNPAGLGPAVYVNAGTNLESFYGFYIEAINSTGYIFSSVNGVTTVLTAAIMPLAVVNDVLRLEIAAGVLVAKVNGTVVLVSPIGVSISFGSPGVQGENANHFRVNDWEGGNISTLPVLTTPVGIGPWIYLGTGIGVRMTLENFNLIPLDTQIDIVGFTLA